MHDGSHATPRHSWSSRIPTSRANLLATPGHLRANELGQRTGLHAAPERTGQRTGQRTGLHAAPERTGQRTGQRTGLHAAPERSRRASQSQLHTSSPLLEFTELAKPVEMPRLCCNTRPHPPPQPRRVRARARLPRTELPRHDHAGGVARYVRDRQSLVSDDIPLLQELPRRDHVGGVARYVRPCSIHPRKSSAAPAMDCVTTTVTLTCAVSAGFTSTRASTSTPATVVAPA